jgi:NAD/NADP transhydrogenase beta subunit
MNYGFQSAAYIAASVLFILSLGGLSGHESAKRAVWYGMAGMAIAVAATVFSSQVGVTVLLIAMLALGALLGAVIARRVEMTGMPQLVAALHSFVGLAAVLIGVDSDLTAHEFATAAEAVIHESEIVLGVFIGAITFSGSIIAFGKLSGRISGAALVLPGRHAYNIVMLVASLLLMILYIQHLGSWTLYAMTLIAVVLGAHLVMAIGGADMPVVVSMLNSYSGWAAAATGFLLGTIC